jgi:hypothetical protein
MEIMKPFLHALFLTILILLVNLNLPTMLRQDEQTWRQRLEYHESEYPFSLRPLTNVASRVLTEQAGLTVRDAFIVGQYPLLFVLFVSFAGYLRMLGLRQNRQIIGVWMLGLSFPILCVHFIPNYTWDDLWAYIGLVWMAGFLARGKFFFAAVCLTFAALSRESMLIAAPAIFVFRRDESWRKRLIAALLPIVLYGAYRLLLFPDVLAGRFTRLLVNFGDAGEVRQTIHSLFVSFGCLWVLAALPLVKTFRAGTVIDEPLTRRLADSALIVAMLTVVLTLTASLARETRLFFTPFVFIIPSALVGLDGFTRAVSWLRARKSVWLLLSMAIAICCASMAITVLMFPSYPFLPMLDFHRVFFGLHLAASAMVLLVVCYGSRSYGSFAPGESLSQTT